VPLSFQMPQPPATAVCGRYGGCVPQPPSCGGRVPQPPLSGWHASATCDYQRMVS
jgi:hypothetical protein